MPRGCVLTTLPVLASWTTRTFSVLPLVEFLLVQITAACFSVAPIHRLMVMFLFGPIRRVACRTWPSLPAVTKDPPLEPEAQRNPPSRIGTIGDAEEPGVL